MAFYRSGRAVFAGGVTGDVDRDDLRHHGLGRDGARRPRIISDRFAVCAEAFNASIGGHDRIGWIGGGGDEQR